MKVLAADCVLPIKGEPISGGAVAIEDDTIVDVGTRDRISSLYPEADIEDFGAAAILPGFVNAHSHLELTAFRGALDSVEHDFQAWLLKLNAMRAALSFDDIRTAALAGAYEGARSGVTCFADIGRLGSAGLRALKHLGLRGVVYQETEFSPDDRTANDELIRLAEKYSELHDHQTKLVKAGISPHAPYTVSRRLFEKIAQFASDRNIKLTIHAAESQEEDELMRLGRGFFINVYQKFGLEWTPPLCGSIEFLAQTGILQNRPLLAHCVKISEEDIETIAANNAAVAHCPKSNAKFGHGTAPLESLLDLGIAVGLGSDSVASNNVCDLLDEARAAALFARNRPGRRRIIEAREVLEAATIGGARSLGLSETIGSLEPGKQADIAVISLNETAQQPTTDAYATLVFSSNARDVSVTMVAGREVYRNGVVEGVDKPELTQKLNEIALKLQRTL